MEAIKIELTIRGEAILLTTAVAVKQQDQLSGLVHHGCFGFVARRFVTPPWAVLCCQRCNLRVLLPGSVDTYEELARWALGHIS